MRIGFYGNQLSERGATAAQYDYARLAEERLGHEAVILHLTDDPGNHPGAVARFRARFEVIGLPSLDRLDDALEGAGCDLVYAIKAGRPDAVATRRVPMMVHAVFPAATSDVHGASFAFVSDWLSDWCTAGRVPAVPHLVQIGTTDETLRGEMGIPAEARVFGFHGGSDSFNIPFVRDEVMPEALARRKDIWFAFMNVTPFMDHPRVRFLPGTVEMERKTAFINSCDAMLHARKGGESFGLACGEFALRGKPVITYARSPQFAHLAIMGERCLRYRGAADLLALLERFDPAAAPRAADIYRRRFSEAPVTEAFDRHLVQPALAAEARFGPGTGMRGAAEGLGLRPWHALRLPLARAGLVGRRAGVARQ